LIKIYFLFWFFGLVISAGRISAQIKETEESLPAVIPVSLEQLMDRMKADSGNVLLLNVWASWCKPCRDEMPALVKLQKTYYGKGFRLIMIAIDDLEIMDTIIKPILKKNSVSFPTYILSGTPDEVFIEKMHPEWSGALPASFIYGREGTLIEMMMGGKSYQQFERVVSKLLKR
jgi:thiol-disulfide isomerase/thioredoxin